MSMCPECLKQHHALTRTIHLPIPRPWILFAEVATPKQVINFVSKTLSFPFLSLALIRGTLQSFRKMRIECFGG
jgi:hypothetical protein